MEVGSGEMRLPLDVVRRIGVELSGFSSRDAQAAPRTGSVVLGDVDNLSDVVGIVGELPINGLQNAVRLASNKDGAFKIGIGERRKRCKQSGPTGLPPANKYRLRVGRSDFKLSITITAGFLAIGGQEIGPAGKQIAA